MAPGRATRRLRGGGKAKRRPAGWRPRLRRALLCTATASVAIAVVATVAPVALLRIVAPPTTAFMQRSRVADPATGRACARIHYRWVPWSRISPHLPRAVLVAEDQRFLEHAGFDTKAIGHAVGELAAGGRMRGASTISQQVAKNIFLWPGRSVLRKGAEAWLTVWIELLWPKRRIAEVYVNVAQFGPCVFGAEAASQRYFGRPAADLSAMQAALLAAVLPAPGRMHAGDPGPFTEQRAREIEAEMRRGGGPTYLRGL